VPSDPAAVVMAYPVEGWRGSAAVVVRQADDGAVEGTMATRVDATPIRAWTQALATLSLMWTGPGFPAVGSGDPVSGDHQARHGWRLRPVCFHRPYAAAFNLVVGERIQSNTDVLSEVALGAQGCLPCLGRIRRARAAGAGWRAKHHTQRDD
jgi:hypothetical protein